MPSQYGKASGDAIMYLCKIQIKHSTQHVLIVEITIVVTRVAVTKKTQSLLFVFLASQHHSINTLGEAENFIFQPHLRVEFERTKVFSFNSCEQIKKLI